MPTTLDLSLRKPMLDPHQRRLPNLSLLMASNTFTLFPDLPLEIRLQVWRLVFPQPRSIYISRTSTKGRKRVVVVKFIEYQYSQKPSPLLRTNWESRLCYLDTYSKLSLDTCAFFDPLVDILHLDRKSFASLVWDTLFSNDCALASKDVLKKIRRIETDADGAEELVHKHKQSVKEAIGPFLGILAGLEEICWVVAKMGASFRRYKIEVGALSFHQMDWGRVYFEVGDMVLRDTRNALKTYRILHPYARIPTMKVEVKIPYHEGRGQDSSGLTWTRRLDAWLVVTGLRAEARPTPHA